MIGNYNTGEGMVNFFTPIVNGVINEAGRVYTDFRFGVENCGEKEIRNSIGLITASTAAAVFGLLKSLQAKSLKDKLLWSAVSILGVSIAVGETFTRVNALITLGQATFTEKCNEEIRFHVHPPSGIYMYVPRGEVEKVDGRICPQDL